MLRSGKFPLSSTSQQARERLHWREVHKTTVLSNSRLSRIQWKPSLTNGHVQRLFARRIQYQWAKEENSKEHFVMARHCFFFVCMRRSHMTAVHGRPFCRPKPGEVPSAEQGPVSMNHPGSSASVLKEEAMAGLDEVFFRIRFFCPLYWQETQGTSS